MQLPLTISDCPHLSQAFVKSQITRPHLEILLCKAVLCLETMCMVMSSCFLTQLNLQISDNMFRMETKLTLLQFR